MFGPKVFYFGSNMTMSFVCAKRRMNTFVYWQIIVALRRRRTLADYSSSKTAPYLGKLQ